MNVVGQLFTVPAVCNIPVCLDIGSNNTVNIKNHIVSDFTKRRLVKESQYRGSVVLTGQAQEQIFSLRIFYIITCHVGLILSINL